MFLDVLKQYSNKDKYSNTSSDVLMCYLLDSLSPQARVNLHFFPLSLLFANLFHVVFESFIDYVAVEQLDGDNKYDAGEHGLQVFLFLDFKIYFYVLDNRRVIVAKNLLLVQCFEIVPTDLVHFSLYASICVVPLDCF